MDYVITIHQVSSGAVVQQMPAPIAVAITRQNHYATMHRDRNTPNCALRL